MRYATTYLIALLGMSVSMGLPIQAQSADLVHGSSRVDWHIIGSPSVFIDQRSDSGQDPWFVWSVYDAGRNYEAYFYVTDDQIGSTKVSQASSVEYSEIWLHDPHDLAGEVEGLAELAVSGEVEIGARLGEAGASAVGGLVYESTTAGRTTVTVEKSAIRTSDGVEMSLKFEGRLGLSIDIVFSSGTGQAGDFMGKSVWEMGCTEVWYMTCTGELQIEGFADAWPWASAWARGSILAQALGEVELVHVDPGSCP